MMGSRHLLTRLLVSRILEWLVFIATRLAIKGSRLLWDNLVVSRVSLEFISNTIKSVRFSSSNSYPKQVSSLKYVISDVLSIFIIIKSHLVDADLFYLYFISYKSLNLYLTSSWKTLPLWEIKFFIAVLVWHWWSFIFLTCRILLLLLFNYQYWSARYIWVAYRCLNLLFISSI